MLRYPAHLGLAAPLARALVLVLLSAGMSGCQTIDYYHQAIRGQYQILREREPITELIRDPELDPGLSQKFRLVLELRAFAKRELLLPIDSDYLTYVDLSRPFVVWNVHAAPRFSLEPKTWWYPFVGKLKYRGYFAENDAREYARELAADGYDVYVEGVEAYSTLGWFSDPLLNTFIHHSEPILAEILFHELAHQRLFVSGDTDFNEAFATAVAEEAVRRWLLEKGDRELYRQYLLELQRLREFVALVMNTRRQLQILYKGPAHRRKPFRQSVFAAPFWMREEKERVLLDLREGYAELKESWNGASGYDGWFAGPLNNAQLNTIAVYYELVPGFERLLQQHHGNLEQFYRDVRELGRLSKNERRKALRSSLDDTTRPQQP